jgi:peptidoglycan/LPS O-acetylase OafA/YrhL
VRLIGLLAAAAIIWRVIAIEVMSPGWVYNATDTNLAAILAGSHLAAARPRPWRWAGWSVPALVLLTFLPVFGEQGAGFPWGFFVAMAVGVIAIQHALTRPAWLEASGLVWVGRVSYGLYLWHYVMLGTDLPPWAAIPVSVGIAAASWYIIEKPLLTLARRFRRQPDQPRRKPLDADRLRTAPTSRR